MTSTSARAALECSPEQAVVLGADVTTAAIDVTLAKPQAAARAATRSA